MKKNFRDISLTANDTIEDAIRKLKNPYEIVLIIDNNNLLIGTITDGDIRRALLKHIPQNEKIIQAMNHNPITCQVETKEKFLKNIFNDKNIRQIPIVDKSGCVVDIKVCNTLVEKKRFPNTVFLMAGGFGTRLQPLTNNTPKPLLKLGDKAILEIIIDGFISQGFHNFFISTHFLAQQIENYFGDGSRMGVSIEYVHEDEPLGTGGALGLLPKDIKSPIIMMNGDLITDIDFAKIMYFHNKNKNEITMCTRKYEFQVPYGVIESDDEKVTGIIEKPTKSFFVNAGIYIINPNVFNNLYGLDYLDMPDLIKQNIKLNKNVNIFPLHEYWLDIGQIDNYEKAKLEFEIIKKDK